MPSEAMLRVNEIFYSLQGEGVYTGTPAVFLRLSGCNRACPFCDTDFSSFTTMTPRQVLSEISRHPARHLVITGGEPAMQLSASFVALLKEHGWYVQIETNGSLPVPENVDWVTCSPKTPPYQIQRVDELKLVYLGQDVEALARQFRPLGVKVMELQPCSGANIPQTIAYILDHPHWRLSLQTHKMVDIK